MKDEAAVLRAINEIARGGANKLQVRIKKIFHQICFDFEKLFIASIFVFLVFIYICFLHCTKKSLTFLWSNNHHNFDRKEKKNIL